MSGVSGLQACQVSVGDLLDLVARSGDLFYEGVPGPSAMAGIRAHQTLQAKRGEGWEKEVSLSCDVEVEGVKLRLSGRADLINVSTDPIQVEEIKSTLVPPERLPDSRKQFHQWQARLYAWMLVQEIEKADQRHSVVRTIVCWYDVSRDQTYRADELCPIAELNEQVLPLLIDYVQWRKQLWQKQHHMIASARVLAFPFSSWRGDQLSAARALYAHIREQQNVLLEAPTGSGKTVTVLFAAVKAMGESLAQKILYLSARVSGQQPALETLMTLQECGWQGRVLQLPARSTLCPCLQDEMGRDGLLNENGQCCRTVGFYDRLPAARLSALDYPQLHREQLLALADQHQLCPFALAMAMVPWVDAVIADVNYLFDPSIQLTALLTQLPDTVVLLDEAHNLPDRARSMYSQRLGGGDFDHALRVFEHLPEAKPLRRCGAALKRSLKQHADSLSEHSEPPKDWLKLIDQLQLAWSVWQSLTPQERGGDLLSESEDPAVVRQVSDTLKQMARYRKIADVFDESFRHERVRHAGKTCVTSSLICLDASRFLHETLTLARSAIAFSATLRPHQFYRQSLGLSEASCFGLSSPFPVDRQLTLVAPYIDTRWQQREQSLEPLGSLIRRLQQGKRGKYLVFFPSYHYLDQVWERMESSEVEGRLIRQQSTDNQAEKAEFLDAFFAQQEAVTGFAVLGGHYSEAIDFAGDALDGVVVVSPALAQPGKELAWLQHYYRDRGLDGFAYASRFPGFSKVQQAAGRVIRRETDQGVVVLVDQRFASLDYRALYPTHWRVQIAKNEVEVDDLLRHFWA